MHARTLVVLSALLSFCPAHALAQASSDAAEADADTEAAEAQARILYAAGEAEFAAGRYAEALGPFVQAYELTSHPALLYNIGICHERLGQDEEALRYYERYLEEDHDAVNRVDVERRIAVERERVARARGASSSSSSIDAGPVVLVSTSAAVAIAGAVLLAIGVTDRGAIVGAPSGTLEWTRAEGDLATADTLSAVGGIALGVGVAGAAIGVALWAMPSSSGSDTVRVSFGPTGLRITGQF